MFNVVRLAKDQARAMDPSHKVDCCAHYVRGPAIQASTNVFTNKIPTVRLGDEGVHSVCCGPNAYRIITASKTVFVNGLGIARAFADQTRHCGGGIGHYEKGSPDVLAG
jgi:uncharacterized Zn-binding protein involved in type VI secretion